MFNLVKEAYSIKLFLNLRMVVSSEMIAYPDQVFLIHVGHHVHGCGIQCVIVIVTLLNVFPFNDSPNIVVQRIEIRRAKRP